MVSPHRDFIQFIQQISIAPLYTGAGDTAENQPEKNTCFQEDCILVWETEIKII